MDLIFNQDIIYSISFPDVKIYLCIKFHENRFIRLDVISIQTFLVCFATHNPIIYNLCPIIPLALLNFFNIKKKTNLHLTFKIYIFSFTRALRHPDTKFKQNKNILQHLSFPDVGTNFVPISFLKNLYLSFIIHMDSKNLKKSYKFNWIS